MQLNLLERGAGRVEIIVLNWNGQGDTLECLASLARCEYTNCGVTVVDNGSTDGSVAGIRLAFPGIALLENGANLGFAEGNNRGIRKALDAGCDFVLLINNDTVVDPGIVSAFMTAAEKLPKIGVFGAKIYYFQDKNRLWYAGGYWDSRKLSFGEHGTGEIDRGQFDVLTETEWVIGCAMFIRASVFQSVGLLEPRYFLNNEEIDFCSRARRAGFSCAYVPEARLWHKISASFGGEDSPLKEYFSARNRLLWAQRNTGIWLRLRIYADSARALMRRFGVPLLGLSTPRPFSARGWWWSVQAAFHDPRNRAAFLGVRDFWLRRFGNCPDVVRELSKAWASKRVEQPGNPFTSSPD